MKKLIVICLGFTLIVSCRGELSPETKATNSIREYMRTHLNDFSSYEIVETKIDSGFITEYEDVKDAARLVREKFIRDSFYRAAFERGDSSMFPADYPHHSQPKKIKGWNVYHKFRSKNALGAKVLGYYKFQLDTNYKIVSVIDMDDATEYVNDLFDK